MRPAAPTLVLAMLLAGCASGQRALPATGGPLPGSPGPDSRASSSPGPAASPSAGTARHAGPVVLSASRALSGRERTVSLDGLTARGVGRAQQRFGLDLLRTTCANPGSTVLSPTSAALAVGMLGAGAVGPTRAAVGRVLHLPGLGDPEVAALRAQRRSLAGVRDVQVSNHVYLQKGLRPTRSTLDDIQTAYGAGLRSVNFAHDPAGSTEQVNADVNADTGGLISRLYDKPLSADTRVVLTDAVHLDARWATPFDPAVPRPFTTASGQRVMAPLMGGVVAPRRTAGGWTSVVLPYRGGHLEAVVMLPPKGGCAPTPAVLQDLTSGPVLPAAEVVLPRLHVATSLSLTSTLAALGLPLRGDYSGFAAGLEVGDASQRAVLDVDEDGTKAAAVTGIAMVVGAVRGPSSSVVFDRPFLLLLQDAATHSPLFLAHITDPR